MYVCIYEYTLFIFKTDAPDIFSAIHPINVLLTGV